MFGRACALLPFALLFSVGCRDGAGRLTAPTPTAAKLVNIAGDSLTGVVGQPLTTLAVRAENATGDPMAGIPVRFFIPLGSNGRIDTALVITDSDGLATSGAWTLGTRSGVQTARAHAQSVATVFTAIALPDAPVDLVLFAGNRQAALSGTAVRAPPAVRVVDRFGNGVPGVAVHFAAASGDSRVEGGDAVTDSTGTASVVAWILDSPSESITLVATSPILPAAIVVFEGRVVDLLFNIEIRPLDQPMPSRLHEALERAAARWSAVFSAHSGISQVTMPPSSCTGASPQLQEVITDLVVFVRIAPIDGSGNILASAAACAQHAETGLPVVARITFDSVDLGPYSANDWIDLIAIHELGHALGFGTVWQQRGLVLGAGTADPIFTGQAARREFDTAFDAFPGLIVPVENTGGAGTQDRHWRTSVFQTEVMSAYINSPFAPLSRITIAAMEDIGYSVAYAAADPYPMLPSAAAAGMPALQMRHMEETTPAPRVMPMVRTVKRRH